MTGYGARLPRLLLAGLVGWFAAFTASAPAIVLVGWRDSEHDLKAFLVSTLFGLLVWGGWTALLATAAWLVIALPIALLLPPAWLVRHRQMVLAATTLLTITVVVLKMRVFQDYAASHMVLRFTLYLPYSLFAIFFAVVTAWRYLRSLGV